MSWPKEMAIEIAGHLAECLAEKQVPKRLYTTAEAAKYMGMSDEKVRQLVALKKLRVVKVDANLRFDRRDLDALIEIAKR